MEASELQFVIHLCQAGLLHTQDYRITANRFRRHDKFFEAFALAVGAFVCSSAPFTLGAATTQYNRDLQYEYKKQTIALFVFVLQQNRGLAAAVGGGGLDEDYVSRISRLIIVSQDGGGGETVAGHRGEEEEKGRRGRDGSGSSSIDDATSFIRGALDRIQRQADSMQRQSDKVERLAEQFDNKVGALRDDSRRMRGAVDTVVSTSGIDDSSGRIDAAIHRRMNEIVEANRRHSEKMTENMAGAERGFAQKIQKIGEEYQKVIGIAQQNNCSLSAELEKFKEQVLVSIDLHTRETSAMLDMEKAEIGILNSNFKAFTLKEADHSIQLDSKFDALKAELRRDNAGRNERMMLNGAGGGASSANSSGGTVTQAQMEELKNGITVLIKGEIENERSGLMETVKRDVCADLLKQIEALLEAKIEDVNPGMAQAMRHIDQLGTQTSQNTQRIGALESALHNLQSNVSQIELLTGQMHTFAHISDLAQVSASLNILDTKVDELDENANARMESLSSEWIQTLGSPQSIKSEPGVDGSTGLKIEIDRMEHRITDQLRRHVAERLLTATRPTAAVPQDSSSMIDDVVLKVIQNTRFRADIHSMIAGDLSSHVGENLPSRVDKLEKFVASRTQTAPGFNVFNTVSSSVVVPQSAMYDASRSAASQ